MVKRRIYYLTGGNTESCISNLNNIYYFDNNSTTLIYDQEVKDEIMKWISCGNPSNILHKFGQMAHNKIELCRHTIARKFKVQPSEIYFTSGATESNNIINQGVMRYYMDNFPNDKFSVITSSFEHPSVINIFKHFAEEYPNLDVIYVDPSSDPNDGEYGIIKPSDVEKAISDAKHKVILISIMHANNETGAMQDIDEIGKIARRNKIFFHSDITQSAGKFDIYPSERRLDSFSFSAHKFHGPKGVGCLYLSKNSNDVMNLCFGGEQESHIRPGTENLANIAGMTLALMKAHENRDEKNAKMMELKRGIIDGLSRELDLEVLGPKDIYRALPNTILVLFKDIGKCNKTIVKELDKRNIFVSVGSACQTENDKGSHVLDAIKLPEDVRKKVIRISLSDYNTQEEAEYLIKNIIDILKDEKINKK
jgi:cysteine desulfurase